MSARAAEICACKKTRSPADEVLADLLGYDRATLEELRQAKVIA